MSATAMAQAAAEIRQGSPAAMMAYSSSCFCYQKSKQCLLQRCVMPSEADGLCGTVTLPDRSAGGMLGTTAVQHYSGTAVQRYSSTAVQQYSGTAVQRYSSTAVQQ
jgi:hypothetical protein